MQKVKKLIQPGHQLQVAPIPSQTQDLVVGTKHKPKMGKKLLALTRLRPQISDPTCLHQMSILLIVVFHIRSQKDLAVKHH